MFSMLSAASAYVKVVPTESDQVHGPSTAHWQLERSSAELCGTNMPS